MTLKQCNSCKWHIYVKELESCFLCSNNFFKNKNCLLYENGEINQDIKSFLKDLEKNILLLK